MVQTLSDLDEVKLRTELDRELARLRFPFDKSRREEVILSVTPRRRWWGRLYHDPVVASKALIHLADRFSVSEDRQIVKFSLVHEDERGRTMIQKKGAFETVYFLTGRLVVPTTEIPHYHLREVFDALRRLSA